MNSIKEDLKAAKPKRADSKLKKEKIDSDKKVAVKGRSKLKTEANKTENQNQAISLVATKNGESVKTVGKSKVK